MKIGYLMQAGVPDIRQKLLSGAASHVKHVFDELQELGHQLRLLVYLDGQIWKSDDLEHYELVTTRWFDNIFFRAFESGIRRIQSELRLPYAAMFESLRFAQACRQELSQCDVFFERMGWMGYGGGIAANRLNIPHILEVNGDHLREFESLGIVTKGLQHRLSVYLMKHMIKQTAFVITTGDGWRNRFIKQWDYDPEQIVTVENGSEIVDLLPREQIRSFQNVVGEQKRSLNLVFIGGFDPWQGLPVLFRAVAKLCQTGIDVCLLIIGSGSQKEDIQQLSRDIGIDTNIIFAGRLLPEEYVPLLVDVDIAISPYCGRVEFSGLKLLDYKSAGLPTIASGERGQPNILKHGETGWIVPPCDDEALSQAIQQLYLQPDLRMRMGRQARLEAEKYHRWKNTAEELEKIIYEVIG